MVLLCHHASLESHKFFLKSDPKQAVKRKMKVGNIQELKRGLADEVCRCCGTGVCGTTSAHTKPEICIKFVTNTNPLTKSHFCKCELCSLLKWFRKCPALLPKLQSVSSSTRVDWSSWTEPNLLGLATEWWQTHSSRNRSSLRNTRTPECHQAQLPKRPYDCKM